MRVAYKNRLVCVCRIRLSYLFCEPLILCVKSLLFRRMNDIGFI